MCISLRWLVNLLCFDVFHIMFHWQICTLCMTVEYERQPWMLSSSLKTALKDKFVVVCLECCDFSMSIGKYETVVLCGLNWFSLILFSLKKFANKFELVNPRQLTLWCALGLLVGGAIQVPQLQWPTSDSMLLVVSVLDSAWHWALLAKPWHLTWCAWICCD